MLGTLSLEVEGLRAQRRTLERRWEGGEVTKRTLRPRAGKKVATCLKELGSSLGTKERPGSGLGNEPGAAKLETDRREQGSVTRERPGERENGREAGNVRRLQGTTRGTGRAQVATREQAGNEPGALENRRDILIRTCAKIRVMNGVDE